MKKINKGKNEKKRCTNLKEIKEKIEYKKKKN